MADPQESPISQLLRTLGLTREDLEKHSYQMRQFLTADNANYQRALDKRTAQRRLLPADVRSTPKPISTASSSTRSRSRAGSYTFRADSPPVTPIKSEHVDGPPLRHYNSMEMVIERQRRQNKRERKEKRERDRKISWALPSSPINASQNGVNLDSFMDSRVEVRVSHDESQKTGDCASSKDKTASALPETPQRSKYYRDHTILGGVPHSRSYKDPSTMNVGTPVHLSAPPPSPPSPPGYQFPCADRSIPDITLLESQTNPPALPVTPRNQRTYAFAMRPENSPLPPSSPLLGSSPVGTPHRLVVNLVSSPGPMGPPPEEDEYESLPYTLPPGPYSSEKPDLSYAALVGQAILSSPEHRLTLQEIYDWITIVYPHFKRGETTWMNSIRHVLSTTVCFRKVVRERSLGRTQWAIWDEDLECFEGGGFRKQFCKDMMKNDTVRESSKGRGRSRKRIDSDVGAEERRVKRLRKDFYSQESTSTAPYTSATVAIHPLFPPIRPASHHQPYYESCMQNQPLPAGVIFPPLPAGYNVISSMDASSSSVAPLSADSQIEMDLEHGGNQAVITTPTTSQLDPCSAPALLSTSSSLPELTPNRSSSSPPVASSDLASVKSVANEVYLDEFMTIGGEDEQGDPKVTRKSRTPEKVSRPGIQLDFDGAHPSSDEEDSSLLGRPKFNKTPEKKKFNKSTLPPLPESPTLNRKAASQLTKASKLSMRKPSNSERPATPIPSTPPRRTQQLPVSSVRTPLSSKGVNPAALHPEADDEDEPGARQSDLNKTPRRRVISSGAPVTAPVTPRRLVFPTNQNESPFRTPVGGGGVFSPFRTPNSRSIFDPHDPGALLDEELNRMGTSAGDSPAGLFGKGRGSLLYDSPGFSTSPGQYARWW